MRKINPEVLGELAKDIRSWSKALHLFPGLFRTLCKGREESTTPFALRTSSAGSGVPKTIVVFENLLKDPRNSLKVVILTVKVYYNERPQIKISPGDRYMGQRKFPMQSLRLSSPSGGMDNVDSLSGDV